MATFLHLSFRVKDPQRSAALYTALLDGTPRDPGPQLGPIGVKSINFGRGEPNSLADIIEFWPQDKHWLEGDFVACEPSQHQPFGHLAFESEKSYEELAGIAQKHGAAIWEEERGLVSLVPVVYDYDGNFLEFFATAQMERRKIE